MILPKSEKEFIAATKASGIFDVIAERMGVFEDKHKLKPTIAYINKRAAAALSVELIRELGAAPSSAVLYPVILNGIPVCISDNLGTYQLHLIHHPRKILEVL